MPKTQSLAAQTGAVTAELKLPSVFQAPQEPVVSRSLSPYIAFAHTKKADQWARITAKLGVPEEGDMYLLAGDDTVRLAPAKLAWLCCKQYWAEVNPAGEVLRVSFREQPKPYKEHVEAVVLVYLEDRIVPANISFRSTKCPAAKTMADALAAASDSEAWAARSQAHKETLVCSQPFMRFYGLVDLSPQRTSKSTGLVYRTTTCKVMPTGVPEWRLLKSFCEAESTQKALDSAAALYEQRVGEMKGRAK